jgi:hypothetical protein
MLRFLASGFLTRNLARRVARVIPNPLVRTLAIAAVGYGVNRVVMNTGRKGLKAPSPPRALSHARVRRAPAAPVSCVLAGAAVRQRPASSRSSGRVHGGAGPPARRVAEDGEGECRCGAAGSALPLAPTVPSTSPRRTACPAASPGR